MRAVAPTHSMWLPPGDGAGGAVAIARCGSGAVTGCAWLPGTCALLACTAEGQLLAWQLSPCAEKLAPAPPPVPLSSALCTGMALGLAASAAGALVAVVRAGTIGQLESNKCAHPFPSRVHSCIFLTDLE